MKNLILNNIYFLNDDYEDFLKNNFLNEKILNLMEENNCIEYMSRIMSDFIFDKNEKNFDLKK